MGIMVQSEKGQRIFKFLEKELGLPDEVVRFELHMQVDDLITVRNLDYNVRDDFDKE
jgi:hypothetical protein